MRTLLCLAVWTEALCLAKKIGGLDLASPEAKALIQASKVKELKTFASLSPRPLALQDHDGVIFFRNISRPNPLVYAQPYFLI